MSKTPLKVLVWIPLPPGAAWRGEGIAQTIENILTNSPEDIHYTLVVGAHNHAAVNEAVGKLPHVSVKALGLLPPRLKTYDVESIFDQTGARLALAVLLAPFSRLLRFAERVWNFFYYRILLGLCTFLQRAGLLFRAHAVRWIPSFTIPFTGFLRGTKAVSYWDSFVFEYRKFGKAAPILLKKLIAVCRDASLIITQSQANKRYLNTVLGVDEARVRVITSGSPDYTALLEDIYHKKNAPVAPQTVFENWPDKSLIASTQRQALQGFIDDKINKSILFRLVAKLRPTSKVILISTQFRVHKGFEVLFEILDYCIELAQDRYDLQFIFTSEPPAALKHKYAWSIELVHEITRVSNRQHASLYALSDLILHPSFVEGGLGTYPQFEAASANKPTLNNKGRHTLEQEVAYGSQLASTTGNFTRTKATAKRILTLLDDPEAQTQNILATRSANKSWQDAGEEYAAAFHAASHA